MKTKKKVTREDNWDINEQIKSENKILKEWVTRNYGKKCPEIVEGCVVCEAWMLFDKLKLYEINEKNAMRLASESTEDRANVIKEMQVQEIKEFIRKVRKHPEMFKYLKTQMK